MMYMDIIDIMDIIVSADNIVSVLVSLGGGACGTNGIIGTIHIIHN